MLDVVTATVQLAVDGAGSANGTLPPSVLVADLSARVDVTLSGREAGAPLSYGQSVRLSAAVAGALSAATQLSIDGAHVELSQLNNTLTIAVQLAPDANGTAVLAVCFALEQAAQAPWAVAALPAGVSVAAVDEATVALSLTVAQGVLAAPPSSVANASRVATTLQDALMSAPLRAALSTAGVAATSALTVVSVSVPPQSPPCVGVAISSTAANISVGACSTALLSQTPLTLPGTAISAAVPAEALAAAGASVTSVFYALSFDPHAGTPNSTGVTRLEFHSGNASVAVANLSQLITFELPHTPTAPGASTQAAFWDTAAQRYSTAGVVAMPNPSPPDVTFDWDPNFDAYTQDLCQAWVMSGPPTQGCREVLLNCSDLDQQLTQRVSLDPEESIGDPNVGCGNRTSGIMRVIYGHYCVLWRIDDAGCYWCACCTLAGCLCLADAVRCVAGTRRIKCSRGAAAWRATRRAWRVCISQILWRLQPST